MTLVAEEKHLTVANPNLHRQIAATHPGMAHFAGTGPDGATCRECSLWRHTKFDYHAKGGKYRGMIKPVPCNKYRQLMQGNDGAKVPHDAGACRHFERNDAPPPIVRKSE